MSEKKETKKAAPKAVTPECPKCHRIEGIQQANKDIFACSSCNVTFKYPPE